MSKNLKQGDIYLCEYFYERIKSQWTQNFIQTLSKQILQQSIITKNLNEPQNSLGDFTNLALLSRGMEEANSKARQSEIEILQIDLQKKEQNQFKKLQEDELIAMNQHQSILLQQMIMNYLKEKKINLQSIDEEIKIFMQNNLHQQPNMQEEQLNAQEGYKHDQIYVLGDGLIQITYVNGDIYKGRLNQGKKHGFGEYKYSNGVTYTGYYVNDKMDGQGKKEFFFNGESYEGQWKNDQKHGNGVYIWSEYGTKYVGCYELDKTSGYGEKSYVNGEVYKGYWKDNYRQGQGEFIWANGDKYKGEFQKDKIEGQGVLVWASKVQYEGSFKQSKIEGYGKKTFSEGGYYIGNLQNGLYHGEGEYNWASGQKYVGSYKNGKMDGQGKKVFANGEVYEGCWQNGHRHGKGKFTWPNGDSYYHEDKMHGEGSFTWSTCLKYEGNLVHDKLGVQIKRVDSKKKSGLKKRIRKQ